MRLLLALCLLLSATLLAQQLEPMPPLPERIRYKSATTQEDEDAVRRVRSLLSGEQPLDQVTMVGPFLYDRLKLKDLSGGIPSTYVIPEVAGIIEGTGVTVSKADGLAELGRLLEASDPVLVRRPTVSEFEYLWAIAPGDLTGSIVVSEVQGSYLLWNFTSEGSLLIEDVSAAQESLGATYVALAKLPDTVLETDPLPNLVAMLQQGEELPDVIKEIQVSTKPMIFFLTSEPAIEARVEGPPLIAYVSAIKELLAQLVVEGRKERVYLQFDIQPNVKTVYYLGSQPPLDSETSAALMARLQQLSPPPIQGPVRMLLLEMPEESVKP